MAEKIKFDIRKDFREQTRIFRRLTVSLRAKLLKLFKKYRVKASSDYRKNGALPSSFYQNFFDDLQSIMEKHYVACIQEQEARLKRVRFKQEEEELEQDIKDYVANEGIRQVTLINNSTKSKVQAVITRGLDEGKSIVEISKDLQRSVAFNPARATRIARTETHSAMGYGSQKVAENLGLNQPRKQWVSSGDARVRDWHRNVNNGEAIGLDEDFIVRDQPMSYAGDARGGAINVINCRCFIAYYDSEDELV